MQGQLSSLATRWFIDFNNEQMLKVEHSFPASVFRWRFIRDPDRIDFISEEDSETAWCQQIVSETFFWVDIKQEGSLGFWQLMLITNSWQRPNMNITEYVKDYFITQINQTE